MALLPCLMRAAFAASLAAAAGAVQTPSAVMELALSRGGSRYPAPSLVGRRAGPPDEGSTPEQLEQQGDPHWQVHHKDFLNNMSFWVLIATLIMGVSFMVVQVERNSDRETTTAATKEAPPGGQDEPGAGDNEEWGTSREYMCRLAFCVVSLNVSMILWGIAQEYVTTNVYVGTDGSLSQMPSSLFLVFCNRTFTFLLFSLVLHVTGKGQTLLPFSISGPPAICNGLASWCQYLSLDYVPFTLQTTAKSAKLLPVLIISTLRGRKHSVHSYVEALVIALGLTVFGFETDPDRRAATNGTFVGIALLCAFVILDALTPHLQDRIFTAGAEVDSVRATHSMAFYASIFSFVVLLINGEFLESIRFLSDHPAAILHVSILSYASCLTQYLITYTIKHFGPVTFSVIASLRQLISVGFSVLLFQHYISGLGVMALLLVVGTLLIRQMRLSMDQLGFLLRIPSDVSAALAPGPEVKNLMVCIFAIHVLYCSYSVAQEFLATHTFDGEIFAAPNFLIACNHLLGAALACAILKFQGLPVLVPKLHYTSLPAVTNFAATLLQHSALYLIYFPAHALLKSLKVIPVMLVGRVLRNRTYNRLDYAEATLITVLVAYFVWDFQIRGQVDLTEKMGAGALWGTLMMLCYVVVDSFTPNLEDTVYQLASLDPGQMLFGLELVSGSIAVISILVSGQITFAIHFIARAPECLIYIGLLAVAAAFGSYSCTLTVRLFGPAVFTLIMVSRQVLSLVISVFAFQHQLRLVSTLALIAVVVVILSSSYRQVKRQMLAKAEEDANAANAAKVEEDADAANAAKVEEDADAANAANAAIAANAANAANAQ